MARDKLTIISLNAWAGRSLHPLMRFLRKYKDTTDVFCLQEVLNSDQADVEARHPDEFMYGNLYEAMCKELKGFHGGFALHPDMPARMSQAMFVRIGVNYVYGIDDQELFTPEKPVEDGSAVISARRLQHATIEHNGEKLLIANYHGLWQPGPKTDTNERIRQSMDLAHFMDQHNGPKVLCGDFNLLPGTTSLRILEDGMWNLVMTRKIQGTRTPLYRHFDNPAEPNFADYVFTSRDLPVEVFGKLPDIVSDHAALRLTVR